ncbi:hypothetical protein WA158_003060 [Blastocystis sp. Blastoise]
MSEENKSEIKSEKPSSNGISSGISFSSYRLEPNSKVAPVTHDKQVTLGGVKKPRFKPKARSPIPSATEAPVASQTADKDSQKKYKVEKYEKKERFGDKKKFEKTDRPPMPRGLASSGASFFATGTFRHERVRLNDAEGARRAMLLDQGITERAKTHEVIMEQEENDEDVELPESNNGAMRLPYVYSSINWKEEDEFSPPPSAELLEEVVEDEMMLFSFPSYLPIYKNYPEYAQGFPNIPKGATKAEPFDYVHNNLIGIDDGKIGKMRIHQSGRVTLSINDVEFELGVGIPMKYVEDVAYVNDTTHNMNMLGHLTHRIIVSPSLDVYTVSPNE